MLVFSVFDSTAGVFIKLLPWNAFVIAGLRGLIAALVLFGFYRVRGVRLVINRRSLLGGFFISMVLITFVTATRLTTAASAAMLQYTNPVFIMLFSFLLWRQKPCRRDIASVAAVFAGMFLIFFGDFSLSGIPGNLLAVLSAVFFAGMYLFNHNVRSEEEHLSSIVLGHAITAAIGLPFLFFFPPEMDGTYIFAILALGVTQQAIPHILYGKAIRICSPLTCSLISALGPVLNPVFVFLFLRERPSLMTLLGCAVILAAVTARTVAELKAAGRS